MAISSLQCAAIAGGLGVASHLGYFIRGEHLVAAPKLFAASFITPLCLTVILFHTLHFTLLDAVRLTFIAYWSYFISIWTSMIIYRVFFHRLRAFPGPFPAKLTQFWHASQITKFDNYKKLDKLHAKYGDIVRIGPNMLSIADPAVVDAVHNPHSRCIKSQWYDISYPMQTLHQMRDPAMHDRRRKHGWEKAFVMKSLREYDSRLITYADKLVEKLSAAKGTAVNAAKWLNFYSFDVMGDLTFGRSFSALDSGESHFFIDIIHDGGASIGLLGYLPWLVQILTCIPAALNPITRLLRYSEECMESRKQNPPKKSDITSHLFDAGNFFEDPEQERLLLTGDSRLLIVAGSDTTATTLTFASYYLSKYPELAKEIRKELEEHNISNDEEFSIQGLQYLPYLNGFINEVLRLHPPVPAGVFRDTPTEGLHVGDVFIPGNCTVVTPNYTIQRSPKAFVHPNSFIPERWSTQPDLIIEKDAFFPFSAGKYSCIGRQLALMEVRSVISKLVLEFDITFAQNETGSDLLEKSKDQFTMVLANLDICFTPRKEL